MSDSTLLSSIASPEDLISLDFQQLNQVATEIRARIIEVMSVNGGHLASNLGTVELTLALHKVFRSPVDKFIWDVSHQTYTHKILTGRQEAFSTIRQYKGLCGFSCPSESVYDHFHAGHAGTALSLALGVAATRDLFDEDHYIIPIIGDASLTCGMSLEALNNCSKNTKKLVMILNDNAMSISKNVGAITQILSRMPESSLASLDCFVSQPCTDLSPAFFFEHYGIHYEGPVDGHNIEELVSALEKVKEANSPVLLHVLTNKGQGMPVALANPMSYHGAKPFHLDTGKFIVHPTPIPTFPQVFGKCILDMAHQDPHLVVVTPAMSIGSCLEEMRIQYPNRLFDVGIAESHAVTFGGGLAYQKKAHVVVSIYSTFLQRALDNLFHDVCLQEIPVVFAIDRAGLAGADGATHNGVYDISFLNAMPNMVICQPRDGNLLKDLLHSAFSWNQPTAIRYPNLSTQFTDLEPTYRPLGKGEILSSGSNLLLIGLGHMAQTALAVKHLLKQQGIHATVLDPIFIKPLDSDLLCDLLTSHHQIVTLEEHSVVSGLGAIINHFLMTGSYQNVHVLNLGIPEAFIQHGSHSALMNELDLTPEKICKKISSYFNFQYLLENSCSKH